MLRILQKKNRMLYVYLILIIYNIYLCITYLIDSRIYFMSSLECLISHDTANLQLQIVCDPNNRIMNQYAPNAPSTVTTEHKNLSCSTFRSTFFTTFVNFRMLLTNNLSTFQQTLYKTPIDPGQTTKRPPLSSKQHNSFAKSLHVLHTNHR